MALDELKDAVLQTVYQGDPPEGSKYEPDAALNQLKKELEGTYHLKTGHRDYEMAKLLCHIADTTMLKVHGWMRREEKKWISKGDEIFLCRGNKDKLTLDCGKSPQCNRGSKSTEYESVESSESGEPKQKNIYTDESGKLLPKYDFCVTKETKECHLDTGAALAHSQYYNLFNGDNDEEYNDQVELYKAGYVKGYEDAFARLKRMQGAQKRPMVHIRHKDYV